MYRAFASTVLLFSFISLVEAAERDPLFSATDTLAITLNGPFQQIDRERDKEQKYDGTLSYAGSDGQPVQLDVEYEVRGNFRLQRDVCNYSQLWLDLKRGQTTGTVFENQNKLKLVVQCRQQDRFGDLIIKEYQAYRLFNQMTDMSLAARLVQVTYQYTDSGDSRTHLGLIIEHQDTLAERYGMTVVEENRVELTSLDTEQATRVALFNLLIGNTDFSLTLGPDGEECCHNAKLLNDGTRNYPIPYDFDGSGFVNASYAAAPNQSFGLRNNRQRLFRGYCAHNDSIAGGVAGYQAAEPALLAIIDESREANPKLADSSLDYLGDFFALIKDPAKVQRDVLGDCRG